MLGDSQGDLFHVHKHEGGSKDDRARPCSVVSSDRVMGTN